MNGGSLGFRIYAGFSLVILLTLGVAGIVFFSLLGGYRSQLDRNSLQTVADQVLFGLEQFRQRNVTVVQLDTYLTSQSRETGALVFFLDAQGQVRQDLSPDDEYENLQLPLSLDDRSIQPNVWIPGEVEVNDGDLHFVARLIPGDQRGDGVFVAVALPDAEPSQVVGDLVPRLLISGLAGLGVALLVGLVITQSIYNPLRRITNAVHAVGSGRYDTRVPEEGPDETRELARALNRMAEQVESNEQALQEFMADVSHELRTPLTSIRGFTQSLLDGTVQDDAQRRHSAQVIDDETLRMLRLVSDLLDLARMQAGAFPLQREPITPSELLEHIVEVFELRADETGITLRQEAAPDLPAMPMDFDRMVQVLTNLVANAIQHTRAGSITIGASRKGGNLLLAVSDTGEGIGPSDIESLFERFYRGASTARRRGTGLGLAITREIVRAHGGDVDVTSVPGQGTTFRIVLPIDPPPPA
jgi:signal transduction histidine kinase